MSIFAFGHFLPSNKGGIRKITRPEMTAKISEICYRWFVGGNFGIPTQLGCFFETAVINIFALDGSNDYV